MSSNYVYNVKNKKTALAEFRNGPSTVWTTPLWSTTDTKPNTNVKNSFLQKQYYADYLWGRHRNPIKIKTPFLEVILSLKLKILGRWGYGFFPKTREREETWCFEKRIFSFSYRRQLRRFRRKGGGRVGDKSFTVLYFVWVAYTWWLQQLTEKYVETKEIL